MIDTKPQAQPTPRPWSRTAIAALIIGLLPLALGGIFWLLIHNTPTTFETNLLMFAALFYVIPICAGVGLAAGMWALISICRRHTRGLWLAIPALLLALGWAGLCIAFHLNI